MIKPQEANTDLTKMLENDILDLADWVRDFAAYTQFQKEWPDRAEVWSAIATNLPSKLQEHSEATAQELLQAVGIMAVVKIGDERVAWAATIDAEKAKVLQQLYNSVPYSQIRHTLKINAHWILLLSPKSIDLYTKEDLFEAHMTILEVKDSPESVIVHL